MRKKIQGTILLLLATVIWGFSFIAQSVGMEQIGPFTFQAVRCLLAVLFLFPCSLLMDLGRCSLRQSLGKWANLQLWRSGVICGCALFVAASLQQVGIYYTDAGKAGFITAMYIVLVPVLGLFLGQKPPVSLAFSVAIAAAGLYLLSCAGAASINQGDLLVLGSALAFAVQITCIDRLCPGLDGLRLNCIQSLVVAVLSVPFVVLRETVSPSSLLISWQSLVFAGVLSMGVAYTFQILGQKALAPATAALIMSLESVFAALGGWWLLGETMQGYQLLGCGMVFFAVVMAQLPTFPRRAKK